MLLLVLCMVPAPSIAQESCDGVSVADSIRENSPSSSGGGGVVITVTLCLDFSAVHASDCACSPEDDAEKSAADITKRFLSQLRDPLQRKYLKEDNLREARGYFESMLEAFRTASEYNGRNSSRPNINVKASFFTIVPS